MNSNPQTQAEGSPIQAQNKRKLNLNRIRSSLQQFDLLKQNRNIAYNRLETLKNERKKSESSGSTSSENEITSTNAIGVEIFHRQYEVLEKIGEGSNGVVNRCVKNLTGKEYAVKSFRFEDEHLPGLKANFLVINSLNHPNIINYEALYIDSKIHRGYLVMEFLPFPSLDTIKLKSEQEIKNVMIQLLDALDYLLDHDIVHRDIKPENILYDPLTKQIKIIDFGISKRFKKRGAHFEMWTITGTLFYRAPQMFEGGYREAIDIWAAGIVLYWLVCGKTPFESEYHSETIKNIREGELVFPKEFNKFSQSIRALITKMLTRNPENRADAYSCLRDPWFKGVSLLKTKIQKNSSSKQNETSLNPAKKMSKTSVKSNLSFSVNQQMLNELKMTKNAIFPLPSCRKIKGSEIQIIESSPILS